MEDKIKQYKPNIKPSTIKAYIQNLEKIKMILNLPNDNIKTFLKALGDKSNIDALLNTLQYTTIRNYYNSIIVLLQAYGGDKDIIEAYIKHRDIYNNQYKEWASKNEMSGTQKKNWVEMDEVIDIMNSYNNKEGLQKYTLLRLFIEYPLRNSFKNLEITTMAKYNRLTKEDKAERNFFIKQQSPIRFSLAINDYKTYGTYGEKVFNITDPALTADLSKFLRVSKHTSYLFTDGNTPFTSTGLTKYFNSIFKPTGKSISTTLLRHIITSDKMGANHKEQMELSDKMGHSVAQNKDYIKYK